MSEGKYLLPIAPVVVGFVISFALIGASIWHFRSSEMIGAGIVMFLLSLGLLFIVRNENESVTDKNIQDWRDIKDDVDENARFDEQAERSMLVEAGLGDLDIVATRVRQGNYLFGVLVVLAALGILIAFWQDELTTIRAVAAAFAPYGIWSAYWGAVSIFARGPNPEHRGDDGDLAERQVLGNARGAEAIGLAASLLNGILGAGPMEFLRHRRVLAGGGGESNGIR